MTEKKENKKINLDLIILAVIAGTIFLYWVFLNPLLIRSIDIQDVEQITMHCRPIHDDEVEQFVELYNSSKYGGQYKNDAGSTPNFSVEVYFTNGDKFTVWDDDGRLIVSPESGKSFYIRNKELYTFLLNQ